MAGTSIATRMRPHVSVPQRPAVDLVMLKFDTPPSVNGLYKNAGKGRIRTDAYNDWRGGAMNEILAQRPGRVPGRFGIALQIKRQSANSDIDNRIKSALDVIAKMGVIDNDNLCEHVEASWTDDPEISGVEVRIWAEPEGRK